MLIVFVNDKLSQTYFNVYCKPFFVRVLYVGPILLSELKYVLYVWSHYGWNNWGS